MRIGTPYDLMDFKWSWVGTWPLVDAGNEEAVHRPLMFCRLLDVVAIMYFKSGFNSYLS